MNPGFTRGSRRLFEGMGAFPVFTEECLEFKLKESPQVKGI